MKYKKRGRRVKKTNVASRLCKRFSKWFKKLSKPKKVLFVTVITLLLLAVSAVAFAYFYIDSKMDKVDTLEIKEEEIEVNEEVAETVGTGYTNFVLFGSDSRSDDVSQNLNTDTIIIASLNNATKEVKLVSVYRDTLLDVKGGNIQKCNSAYARGGAAQAINMLNKNLDLNIKKYVTVSFSVVVDIVDMLGGLEIDVTDKEAKEINNHIDGTGQVAGKKAIHLKKGGLQKLDGVQATTYARIRKGVGDDYARTERQRLVIEKIFEKMLQSDMATINKIIDAVVPQVSTNFTTAEIMSYAAGIFGYSIGDSVGFPFKSNTATLGRRGSCLYATTLESNVSQLHELLYGEVGYKPSSAVRSISNDIAYLVSTNKTTSSSSSDDDDLGTPPVTELPSTDTTTPPTGDGSGNSGTTTPPAGDGSGNSGTTTPPAGDGSGNSGTTTPPAGDGSGNSGTTTPTPEPEPTPDPEPAPDPEPTPTPDPAPAPDSGTGAEATGV